MDVTLRGDVWFCWIVWFPNPRHRSQPAFNQSYPPCTWPAAAIANPVPQSPHCVWRAASMAGSLRDTAVTACTRPESTGGITFPPSTWPSNNGFDSAAESRRCRSGYAPSSFTCCDRHWVVVSSSSSPGPWRSSVIMRLGDSAPSSQASAMTPLFPTQHWHCTRIPGRCMRI